MLKFASAICFLFFVLYVVGGIFLFIKQRSFIYFPSEIVKHNFDVVTFSNEGNNIEVIALNREMESAIVYFGGNAEAVAYSAKEFDDQFKSHAIYLVNYRGYGGSNGEPNEAALYSDALHIYDKISPIHKEIVVVGRSLGSGVASYLATKRHIKQLVLVTPFDSIQQIAQSSFPMYPMSILLMDKYKSIDRTSDIQAEVLILAAEKDIFIPLSHTKNLVDAFSPTPIEFVIINDAGHNDISEFELYYRSIKDFIFRG